MNTPTLARLPHPSLAILLALPLLLPHPVSHASDALAKQKNCTACHAYDKKLVGPSFLLIGQTHAGQAGAVEWLSDRIINGSSGRYGPVPMPPNPQVSPAEARTLAQWILDFADHGNETGTVHIDTQSGAGGEIIPAQTSLPTGTVATFTIKAHPGNRIASVTGCPGTLTNSVFTTPPLTSNCTLSARFEPVAYLTLMALGRGSYASTAFNCLQPPCRLEFSPPVGASLLASSPAAGWTFEAWGGACRETGFRRNADTGQCHLTVTGDAHIVALFSNPATSACQARDFTRYEIAVLTAYLAYYGRPADPAGLAWWAEQLEYRNGDLHAIIDSFGNSAEFVDRFSHLTPAELIDNLYLQLFGRTAEPTGRDYYEQELMQGRRSLIALSLDILHGAQGEDLLTVEQRLRLARHVVTRWERTPTAAPSAPLLAETLTQVDHQDDSAQHACTRSDALF